MFQKGSSCMPECVCSCVSSVSKYYLAICFSVSMCLLGNSCAGQLGTILDNNRCDARWYGTPSEDERCYDLQMKLAEAADKGDIPAMKDAMSKGANVNGGAYQSLSALTAASYQGHHDAVLFLIQSGAKVNRVQGVGSTALKSAVVNGHKKTIEILLDNGADICESTESSALQYALESGNAEIIDMLIKAGAEECNK